MTPPHDLMTHVQAALGQPGAASSDFDLNPDKARPQGQVLRDAAVLILLSDLHGAPQVYLTKRASGLKHHPGQIAFAGGKLDDTDADLQSAALREANEEIGLPHGASEILGQLPPHETVTGFAVTPFVAKLTTPFTPRSEQGEVAEVFTVPLAYVLNPNNFSVQGRRWRGTRRHYYTVPYGPYYIWGATARMLHALADCVKT